MSTHKPFFVPTLKEVEFELKRLIGLGWRILSVSQTSTGYVITAEETRKEQAA